MSDAVTLQLGIAFITALFVLLNTVVVAIFGLIARRDAAKAVVEVKEVKADLKVGNETLAAAVEQVHQATNGMKSELVEAVREASFAKGVKSETDKHGGQS